MALIDKENFHEISKMKNNVHNDVEATYTSFISNEKRYFQIDTYGAYNRQNKGIASQSIQFDRETAKFLCELLKKHLIFKHHVEFLYNEGD